MKTYFPYTDSFIDDKFTQTSLNEFEEELHNALEHLSTPSVKNRYSIVSYNTKEGGE